MARIYKPKDLVIRQPGSYRPSGGDLRDKTYTSKRQQELIRQKESKKDKIFRQIGTYSEGAQQDAARRAGIRANATSKKEGMRILQQLQSPGSSRRSGGSRSSSRGPSQPQSDPFADQLRIIQEENARMMDEYRKMMQEEEERRRLAAEEQKMALQTARANRMREGSAASLQIQPAGSTPDTAGTQRFRRRASQFGTGSPYTGLSTISSGMVNV